MDENGLEYPAAGATGIKKCPRRVGIVSQGLITSKTEAANCLKQLDYECIIVDEAHRARRANLGLDRETEKLTPNIFAGILRGDRPSHQKSVAGDCNPCANVSR